MKNHTQVSRRISGGKPTLSKRGGAFAPYFSAGFFASLIAAGGAACARFAGPTVPTGSFVVTPSSNAPAPDKAALFSATQAIQGLAVGPNGAIWAATEGGVLRWPSPAAAPQMWTTSDGLLSNDVRAVRVSPTGDAIATFPLGQVKINTDDAVSAELVEPVTLASAKTEGSEPLVTARAQAGRDTLTATPSGLVWERDGQKQIIPLPAASRASHVSALLPLFAASSGQSVFAASLYGDGITRLVLPASAHALPRWETIPGTTPSACRFVTALAVLPEEKGGKIVIGTRHDGAFVCDAQKGGVTPLPLTRSLPSGDVYGIAAYHDHLWATTFDQGVLEMTDASANGKEDVRIHPSVGEGRTLVPFGDKLYVLRADHSVWTYDGTAWQPAWPPNTLKRAEVFSLAADEINHRLLVGGWGGWAEWNGGAWQQHWGQGLLKNESITALCADKTGAVWLGTQRNGLIRRTNGDEYAAFQEAQGLTDDWITCVSVSPRGRLLVGTYTGGLLEWDNGRFVPRFSIDKWAIRTLAWDGETVLAATPVGVYRETNGNGWQKLPTRTTGGSEIQALFPTPHGLWIGTRSGLAFSPHEQ